MSICCCCRGTLLKFICKRCVYIFSVILIFVAVVTMGFGGLAVSIIKLPELNIGLNSQQLGLGCVVFGALALLIGCCGCMTAKWMKPWCAIPLVVLAFVVGVAVFIAGTVMSGFAPEVISTLQEESCNLPWLITAQNDYETLVDKYMCSRLCPCPRGELDIHLDFW